MRLERYRDIVPEWDRLLKAVDRPEPTTLRVRTGRIEPGRLVARLRAKGFQLEPVEGLPAFFRVTEEPHPVSKTLEHWLGLFYIQQVVTGVAGPALAPRPGERVLDLCAAPGGKTVHLAELMEDRGLLVAADADDKRLRALLGNLYRLGHTGVMVVHADGRTFPDGARFDRVLVDAPCSAEGNLRQQGGDVRGRDPSFVEYITGIQEALLRRALHLVRPGGEVLYVTCTFAPEENEAVVDAVLGDGGVELLPISLDLPHAPGLTAVEDRTFDSTLERAWRLYPHHLDSGGLFMARLRRTGDGARSGDTGGWYRIPRVFPGRDTPPDRARNRIEKGIRGFREGFGVADSALSHLQWIVRGKSVWGHSCASWPVPSWEPDDDWRVLSLGLRALKRDPRTVYGERPTSDLLRMLDGEVREATVDLDCATLLRVLERRPLEIDGVERGFAALRHEGRVLGRAWVKEGCLHNEISKARSRRLIGFLEAGAGQTAAPDTATG